MAGRAGALLSFEPFIPPDFFARVFFTESVEQQSCAVALRTPAMLRVEREQTRVEFFKTAAALWARAAGGKQLLLAFGGPRFREAALLGFGRTGARPSNDDQPF